jgi:hypothetical protein
VFAREIKTEYGKKNDYSIVFQRSYTEKDENGKETWKNTNFFKKSNIANIQALLNRVSDYLLITEDEEEE